MKRETYLICELARRRVAISVGEIREILPSSAPTPVPGAPALVRGIIIYRGDPLTILDIRPFIEPELHITWVNTRYVVLSAEERRSGLVVDRAIQVLTLEEEIVASEGLSSRVGQILFPRILRRGEEDILILDGKGLLDQERIRELG